MDKVLIINSVIDHAIIISKYNPLAGTVQITTKIKRFKKSLINIQNLDDNECFKGYLCNKTIFCHNVALDGQLMGFFIWRIMIVSFSRYLGFSVFVRSTDFKTYDVIIGIAT